MLWAEGLQECFSTDKILTVKYSWSWYISSSDFTISGTGIHPVSVSVLFFSSSNWNTSGSLTKSPSHPDPFTISTLISRLEPLGTSAVQTKNSPGATTGGQTTWSQIISEVTYSKNWPPCPYPVQQAQPPRPPAKLHRWCHPAHGGLSWWKIMRGWFS